MKAIVRQRAVEVCQAIALTPQWLGCSEALESLGYPVRGPVADAVIRLCTNTYYRAIARAPVDANETIVSMVSDTSNSTLNSILFKRRMRFAELAQNFAMGR